MPTQAVIHDQEEAGLDIVCDGQMCFDDYIGMIGSFCWCWYERVEGFDPAKEEHPAAVGAETISKEIALLSDWGGVINSGPVERGPARLADLYKIAKRCAWDEGAAAHRRHLKLKALAGGAQIVRDELS